MTQPGSKPSRIPRDPQKAFQLGLKTGQKITQKEATQQVRAEVLGHLESKYMHNDVERDTPEAKAILNIARELSSLLKVDPT